MFLTRLLERNPGLVEAVVSLHQRGDIPACSYVVDVDAVEANAAVIAAKARELDLEVFVMTKQFGRNPVVMEAVRTGGIESFVAVDVDCAKAVTRSGNALGHVGHLVQVPKAQVESVVAMNPRYWTVFSEEKGQEVAAAADAAGREQRLLARVYGDDDRVFPGQEGGFRSEGIESLLAGPAFGRGARLSGVTTYPALMFNKLERRVEPTSNLRTLEHIAARLRDLGVDDVAVNAPGETSAEVLPMLANGGATQVEPGHALTGTTPLHAFQDLPEKTAMVYVTEVSHTYGGRAYCYGGGLYQCMGSVDHELMALAGREGDATLKNRVRAVAPPAGTIDFYVGLEGSGSRELRAGDSVVFAFRAQAFFTRARVVPVRGVGTARPEVLGVWATDGREAA